MKALIFNSGLGSRLGALTADRPKCMVRLGNGETIFHRQLRILYSCGIREFVVTTGPFSEQIVSEAESFRAAGCSFEFVENSLYQETNYIYSMWLARSYLSDSDFLLLHGDLVFDASYVQSLIDFALPCLGSVNSALPLPDKDFKARLVDGEVREVSVSIFDDGCVAFQPLYKLSAEAMRIWLRAVDCFVADGVTGVYAENAANTVFEQMHIAGFSYEGHFVEEVDTPEDLERVSAGIRLFDFEEQPTFSIEGDSVSLVNGFLSQSMRDESDVCGVLSAIGVRRPLVVSSSYFQFLSISSVLDAGDISYKLFTDYSSNPTFDDVRRALIAFREGECDSVLSVGGGSAIDVAKCVKQLLAMPEGADGESLKQDHLPYSAVPHVAVPTTAGTGSESTHFAVCYVDGEKTSVANDCLLPDVALLDSSNLESLPDYQKKCTLLDALCQAIESYWSRRSCERSRAYSSEAISLIMGNTDAYLSGNRGAAWSVMFAANLAGKAINLTTTTAPHAMSYKLTSLYGAPHGHAVAICMPYCWKLLLERGDEVVLGQLQEIACLMSAEGESSSESGLQAFMKLFECLGIEKSLHGEKGDIETLCSAVNVQRLSNFPIELTCSDIEDIYSAIVLVGDSR